MWANVKSWPPAETAEVLKDYLLRNLLAARALAVAVLVALSIATIGYSPAQAAADDGKAIALSPDDIATLTRVEDYLNRIDTMQARFVQISSNGAYAEGEVYVNRPGQLRFDYDPPHTVLLLSNGLTLLYYDRELKQASYIPLWETPLWFLIREDVKLGDDLVVTGIEEALGTLSVSLQNQEKPESGKLTLIFSDTPLTLRKWEVIDAQGILTQVSLVNPLYGGEIDGDLFDYGDLDVNKGQRQVDK